MNETTGDSLKRALRNETVLLVDDQGEIRRQLGTALRKYGYSVLLAGDGDAALSLCQHHPGRVDALIAELHMPGMSGEHLADRLAALNSGLKVLYVTGCPGIYTGLNVLEKPFTPSQLAQKLSELLAAVTRSAGSAITV